MNNKTGTASVVLGAVIVLMLATGVGVQDGVNGADGRDGRDGSNVGAIVGPEFFDPFTFHSTLNYKINTASTSAAVTLRASQSGREVLIKTTGATYTLPAVTNTGATFTFAVSEAFGTNAVIDSAEGDNIEGSLLVAGATVDCAAEDQINFVADGENLGDYVTVVSDGASWLIRGSNALTAAKLTCTDPS